MNRVRLVKRIGRLVVLLAVATACAAEPRDATPTIEGWHEAVVSVESLDTWVDFWTTTNGWRVVTRNETSAETEWHDREGEPLTGRTAVLAAPGEESGYVRLIQFDAPGGHIRPNAQSWETGGWFDFNVRVVDLERKSRELMARGWNGYSSPVEFTFGPFIVREWLARGPDGVVIAMIERVQPPLEGYPHLTDVSRLFNATQIVPDLDESLAFYQDTLGFDTYIEHDGASKAEGENVLGLPHELADDIVRRVRILHPEGNNLGSVELLQFVGISGRDFSERTAPPNRGILSLRFPAKRLAELAGRIRQSDGRVIREPAFVDLPPYGRVERLVAAGPAGELIEFIDRDADGRVSRTRR